MNVLLVGMMGSGKSTVSKKLAKLTQYSILDTDDEIEKDQGCSIDQIFAYAGEPFFRELEHKKLLELTSVQNTILATGGGIVLLDANWEVMRKIGPVVYLKTSLEKIYERLKNDTKRPLLKTPDPKAFLKNLQAEREEYYMKADLVVDTDMMELNQICYTINHSLHLNSAKGLNYKTPSVSSV